MPKSLILCNVNDSFDTNLLYLFKNVTHGEDAKEHFHVALKVSDDQYIVLLMITSQVEKRLNYYERISNQSAKESLIIVNDELVTCLDRQSCIDCNRPDLYTREELSAKIDGELKFVATDIESSLRTTLVDAIQRSPLVRPNIKKMLSTY